MSQPLESSRARRPSSKYTACELAPPLWNWTLMSRPIDGDGTSRYSTGRPGRENACAVAEPPATPISPGSAAAAAAAAASRRTQIPRLLMVFTTATHPKLSMPNNVDCLTPYVPDGTDAVKRAGL